MAIKETQTADDRARVILPKGFAKATVVVEQVSKTEIRIRKTGGKVEIRASKKNAPSALKARFAEERVLKLSNRDRNRFLDLLDNPPAPNAALRKAMSKHRKKNG